MKLSRHVKVLQLKLFVVVLEKCAVLNPGGVR